MKVDVFSSFPEMLTDYTKQSILGRAIESGLLEVSVHDLRLATTDKHRTIDDPPFGGGAGMVMMPEPVFNAVEELKNVADQVLDIDGNFGIIDFLNKTFT